MFSWCTVYTRYIYHLLSVQVYVDIPLSPHGLYITYCIVLYCNNYMDKLYTCTCT